jgi:SAM-dependent methyltransferase
MKTTADWGDYQTADRMAKKRRAIPLPELKGKRVLDVGCDYGWWCREASIAGAKYILGIDRGREVRMVQGGKAFVDLATRNNVCFASRYIITGLARQETIIAFGSG